MSVFDEEFLKLNSAQQEAVTTINGPVLVIAGPGTGKTQLLSMRVANIMRSSDADASNILCLTFTNKAATNMRDRLLRLVGPESNKVTVKTFHGFAAELMNTNSDFFWNGAKLSTAPDAVQLEIIQTILATLPLSNPLSIRFAGQYTAVDDVAKALRLAKEAGLTPNKLKAMLDVNTQYIDTIEPLLIDILTPTLSAKKLDALAEAISNLPEQGIDQAVAPLLSLGTVIKESFEYAKQQDADTGKTKNVGKWKSRWIQTHDGQKGMHDERKRNDWWQSFCAVYQQYRDSLHTRGYYDYSDMMLEVIEQLEQNANLRASVQERYQYVLIDEFQDSNAAQLRLAHLVADHHTAEGAPNIMAVGDDDQSIFGFNGAELNNMLFFNRNYPSTKQIVLQDNYRSSQAVLNVSDAIIRQAEDRLVNRVEGLSKQLAARNESTKQGTIHHLSYKTQDHQYSQLARYIKTLHSESDDTIAVLARGHESLRQLSSILLELGVPISYEQQTNILEHEVIQQVMLLCELLTAITGGNTASANEKLATLIRHPMWQFSPEDLWVFATSQFSRRDSDWLTMLAESDNQSAQQLAQWLQWLANESTYQPLAITIEQVLGLVTGQHLTSPIREYYLHGQPVSNEYLQGLSAIRLLRQLVNEFSGNNQALIADFIAFVRINQTNNRGIADESPFVSGGRSVELLTVHKAKGLEFDHVFIIDAVEDSWKPRVSGRKPPANLPLQPPGEKDDDYIRLLYVAATRAKHSLYATSYQYDAAGKDVLATPFIRQAIPDTVDQEPTESVSLTQVLEENLRWPRLTITDEKALLKRRMENYNLSATHLLTFLDVANAGPQIFLERHILRLPEATTPAQGFGIAMHSALQFAQKLTNQDAFAIAPILAEYERALGFEHLLPTDYEKYLVHGKDTLTKLFAEGYQLQKGGHAEQQFHDIRIGTACVSGTLDRVDHNDSSITIADYKTGQPLSSFTTRDQTKAIKTWRHRSQLIFYALLVQQHHTFSKANTINTQMVYLEAEQNKDLIREYQPSQAEIDRMAQLVQAVWHKAINLDLPDIAKYPQTIAGIQQFEEDLLSSI